MFLIRITAQLSTFAIFFKKSVKLMVMTFQRYNEFFDIYCTININSGNLFIVGSLVDMQTPLSHALMKLHSLGSLQENK